MRRHYHFIGIGGVGMSALAHILLKRGERVTGSDLQESPVIEQLKKEGAEIYLGHNAEKIGRPAAVIYSSGIPRDNPEYLYAKSERIPILHRSELVSQMVKGYAPLLVTGTHGKTTTACLLSHILMESGMDPSYAVGGCLNGIGTNGRHGKGIYFAVEADESDGSFLNYPSFGAIITNLEHDHMDYWKSEESLLHGFERFAKQVGSNQHLFWCKDDDLLNSLQLDGYSYGFDAKADLVVDSFSQKGWEMHFDLSFKGKHYRDFVLPLIGAHNVLNAAAVFGLGRNLDIDEDVLRKGFASFHGIGRRLEKKGSWKEIDIYDDYAHHPTEIFSTLRAMKGATKGKRVIVAYQPHRFSRTQYCLDDYADAFHHADAVVFTDIFAASEKPIPGITSDRVVERIKQSGDPHVRFVAREKLTGFLSDFLQPGDVLITMGAGDITKVGPLLLKEWDR